MGWLNLAGSDSMIVQKRRPQTMMIFIGRTALALRTMLEDEVRMCRSC